MKKILITLLLLLAASTARAQQTTGTISTNGSDCSVDTRCVAMNVQANTNSVVITLDGTFTGTAQFEQLAPGTTTWRALQVINLVGFTASTSSTAVGSFVTTSPNYNAVRVRASALASGSIGITIRGSNNASLTGLIFGSGAGGTIGTVNQGTAGDASANWLVNCVSGCSGGTSDTDDASIATGQSTGLGLSLNQVFDGTVWRRQTVGVAGTAAAQVSTIQGIASMTPVLVTLSGSNSIVNVSGTVSLPTGASTSAKQPALGTAGTASADVLSVQGITSMTPFLVTLPAETSKNIGTVRLADGGGTALTALTAGAQRALTVSVVDNAGNQVSSFGGSGGTASAFGAGFPSGASSGTAVGFYDGTNMQGARVVDLDTGAGTFYGFAVNNVRRASGGPVEMIGQDTMANSFPVVLASNQSAVPVTGTITAVTAITNALPSGTNVIGHVIVDTTSTTAVTQATAANLNATIVQATAASLNATVVGNGTFAVQAAESGTWTVQPGNTANTTAWLVTGTGGTFPATESGTWTVQPGNTANTTAWLMKGGVTTNNAAPAASTLLGVLPAVANAAAPTYTETNLVLHSVDLHGATRVLLMDSTGTAITPTSDYTQDGALTVATTAGPMSMYRASAAAPTNISADNDAVMGWALQNGAQVVNLAAGGTLITGTSTSLNVNCTGGCSGGTQYTQDGALTVGTSVVTLSGGRASAAVPSDVSADNDAVIAWYLKSGAQATQPTFGGVLATTGNGVSGTGVQRVTIASDSTGQVALAAGSATIGALTANQSVNLAQVAGTNTVTGGTAGSQGVGGTVAHDAVGTGVNPALMGGYASQAAPTDVSADGDATRLWVLRNGSPVANIAAGGTLITATSTSLNTNVTAGTITSLTGFNGNTISTNNGTVDAGTLRVTLASNSTGVVAATLSAETTKVIGTVNIAASQTIAVTNTGTFAAQATLAAETTKVIGTARIIGNAGAIVDGATGAAVPANVLYIGGRASGATGGLLSAFTVCDSDAVVNISTITTTNIITGVSGRKVHICSIDLVTAAANNVALIEGTTGGTCASPAGMAGGTTAASGWNFAANGGLTQGAGLGAIMSTGTANNDVCLVTSATTQLSGHVRYAIW